MRFWLVLLAAVAAEGWIPCFQATNSTEEDIKSLNSRQSESHSSEAERKELGEKRYKVVCYFTNSSWYREEAGKYVPEDIDTNLCTHVIYKVAVLDAEKLEIKVFDSWADIDNNFYKRIASLARKGVKTSIGIGGWTDSAGDKYSRLVNSPAARAHFVQQVTQFIGKYGFTGLDFDWEYPTCWQNSCSRGPASDKEGFSALIEELGAAFRPRNWHLSAAVSPNPDNIDVAYDAPHLSQHLDWINLMAYDFHGSWDRKTGHVAPLHHHNGDTNSKFNVDSAIKYWLSKGMDSKKIVVGMPACGQSFTLRNPNNNGLNAPTTGPGRAGPITHAGGTLAFYEICVAVKREGWKVRRASDGSMGPYAFKGDQWVGYDDISDIKKKGELVKAEGLGGGMIWALDFDDSRNTCGCGRYPLLTALSSTLNGVPAPRVKNCAS